MAKGNMFQGMARGKVGDVVFYRMNGQQMSRVRNRRPKNPRSNAQLYQRAIIATVMRAYSAGKEIFDHSFEGQSVGEGCMRRFLSVNADKLRQAIIIDTNKPNYTDHINGLVDGPKVNLPVPNTYVIAEGSLQQSFLQIGPVTSDVPNANITSTIPTMTEATTEDELLANLQAANLIPGDLITIVGFASATADGTADPVFTTPDAEGAGGFQMPCQFFFVRLQVKPYPELINGKNVTFDMIFDVLKTANVKSLNFMSEQIGGYTSTADKMFTFEDKNLVPFTMGVIRSRDDSKLRSNTEMQWLKWDNIIGIDWQNILLAWTKEIDALGNSELILEGGNPNA